MKITKLKDPQDLEDARVKYTAAIALKCSEGEIQWNRYNAMLIVNTIFIGLIGFTFGKDINISQIVRFIFWFTPIFGLLICESWYKMTERGFKWTQFWMEESNKIEQQFEGQIDPVQEGKSLRDLIGHGITKSASLRIINIFKLIYVLIFIGNIFSVCLITIHIFIQSIICLDRNIPL